MTEQNRIIIVAGTDSNDLVAPVIKELADISSNMNEKRSFFVTTPAGTYRYDKKKEQKKLMTTFACARRVLLTENKTSYRLLLFDTVSVGERWKLVSCMLPWLLLSGKKQPNYLPFHEVIPTFFNSTVPCICWSSLIPPLGYTWRELATTDWNDKMKDLEHASKREQN